MQSQIGSRKNRFWEMEVWLVGGPVNRGSSNLQRSLNFEAQDLHNVFGFDKMLLENKDELYNLMESLSLVLFIGLQPSNRWGIVFGGWGDGLKHENVLLVRKNTRCLCGAIQLLCCYTQLGGGFKYSLCSPRLGEDVQFDEYVSDGLKPPTRQYS